MKKTIASIIVLALLISTIWSIIFLPDVVTAGSPPPPDDGIDGLQYIDGDWNVNGVESYTNETIVLTGNLTVENGGLLTFKNVTLKMNCSSDGQYHIEVLNGASMKILDLDGNNVTTNDASWITANDMNYEFNFWVRDGSNFEMRNSNLTECGYFWFVIPEKEGLLIETDDAIIDHCNISKNYQGIILYNSDAIVSNNTIEWNEWGVWATTYSNGTIENNIFNANNVYGILIDGWDNTPGYPSNPLVKGNKIIYTGRGVNTANAIHIAYDSVPTIIDNEIYNYTEDAIYILWSEGVSIENLTIDADGGNYGIATSAPGAVIAKNCTIKNTALWDISLATAYLEMTNCTFNQSKVIFQGTDSNLTVNWFLNSYVNDASGNPISNANIRIRDNANGTFDKNFTTDVNGYVNWTVLKEYFQKDNNGDKDGGDVGERIDYGPYNITVEKNGYYTNYTVVEMNKSKYITITLLAQDSEKPEIDHMPVSSANISETINITANITDNVGVDIVYLDFTGVNGTNYNVSMNQWGGNWSYNIPGQNNVGLVDYFIWCNDTSGNANMTGINQTQINDITKPEINHFPALSKNIGELINITANITDDVSVNKVFLNYTDVHGDNQNITMNKWDGNYSFEIPGQSNSEFVDYFIWCNDSSDNDNQTITCQIPIFDITDPVINHVPVTSASTSETINITANVTDDVSVSSVYLNYTGVNGTNYNVSMQKWDGNYSYEIPGQNTIGNVQYFIWANDSDGNDNRIIEYSIQILDVIKPEINHVPVVSVNVGEMINITVNVTDNVEVDTVYLNYTDVAADYYNMSMNKYNNNWSYEMSGQNDIGIVSYFVWANDTSNNDNQTQVYQIQILDATKPEIEHTPVSIANVSEIINITAQITDDVEVDSVYLNYTDTNGINHNISMTKWNGNWSYVIIGQLSKGNLTYFVWANDTSGNANQTGIYQIQINEVIIPDTTPPTIISKSPTGANVSISTTITITFNEPMNISSVQNTISITPSITPGYNWNADNTTLTITPSANLSYNTTYNIAVDIGAKDHAKNILASQYSWEFTTELEDIITNGHDDNWLAEYWWVIVILIALSLIIILFYWRNQKKKKEEEKEEQS